MNKFLLLVGGTALGVAAYVVLKQPVAQPADDVDAAAARIGGWGTKQRVGGVGGQLKGKLEQGAASLTGDPDLGNQGAYDEAAGAVQNAVGKAAHAVESTVRDLNS